MLKRVLVFILIALPVSAALADNDVIGAASEWVPQEPLALPALASDVSSSAAGCVVVGHHVLGNGSSENARVLKGAFAGVDAAQQAAFAESVLDAAAAWRFHSSEPEHPEAAFRLQTIGFTQAQGTTDRVIAGFEALPKQLQDVCQIKDLAAWGEANAVPVEQARAKHGSQITVPDSTTGALYWVEKTPMGTPIFPAVAIKANTDACIVVGLAVDEAGAVTKMTVVRSDIDSNLGPSSRIRKPLEDSAMVAAATATFSPGPDNLSRHASIMQVPIAYKVVGGMHAAGTADECKVLSSDALGKVMSSWQ